MSKMKVSDHILQTSSNLLGLCFLILSFVKFNKLSQETYLDEFLVLPILLFFSASILSYFALRSKSDETKYESYADKLFMIGLFSITIISLTFIFEVVA